MVPLTSTLEASALVAAPSAEAAPAEAMPPLPPAVSLEVAPACHERDRFPVVQVEASLQVRLAGLLEQSAEARVHETAH
jgi:hypothetical protein